MLPRRKVAAIRPKSPWRWRASISIATFFVCHSRPGRWGRSIWAVFFFVRGTKAKNGFPPMCTAGNKIGPCFGLNRASPSFRSSRGALHYAQAVTGDTCFPQRPRKMDGNSPWCDISDHLGARSSPKTKVKAFIRPRTRPHPVFSRRNKFRTRSALKVPCRTAFDHDGELPPLRKENRLKTIRRFARYARVRENDAIHGRLEMQRMCHGPLTKNAPQVLARIGAVRQSRSAFIPDGEETLLAKMLRQHPRFAGPLCAHVPQLEAEGKMTDAACNRSAQGPVTYRPTVRETVAWAR